MNDPIEKAQRIQAEYARQVQALEGDNDLTPEARQRRADELHQESSQRMAKLRGEVDEAEHAEVEQLRRSAFGPTYRMTDTEADRAERRRSYRSALDRAEALTSPDQARRLLRRARDTDDGALAKAVAYKAFSADWSGVVSEWLEGASDSQRRAFERLMEASAAQASKERKFAQRMAMSNPPRSRIA